MEEDAEVNEHRQTPSVSSASSSSITNNVGGSSGAAQSEPMVHEENDEEEEQEQYRDLQGSPVLEQQQISISYSPINEGNDDGSTIIREDNWSCVVVVLTFWLFVSMTIVLGVYGPVDIMLGPNSSLLLQPNSIFVRLMEVEELNMAKAGMMLYGFQKPPPLDVVTTWLETYSITLSDYSDKEWIYFLNEGSEFNVSYSVKSFIKSSVVLVIAQGNEGIAEWLEDTSYPNTTLSWNIIDGRGMIRQNIFKSSRYYVALGNLESELAEVQLNISIRATMYDTTKANYKCSLNNSICSFNLSFSKGGVAVLTSSGTNQSSSREEAYVRISYGPRWITYISGIGGMSLLMLVAFNFLNKLQCGHENRTRDRHGQLDSSIRAPLLSQKDDDVLSWGSSYECVSHDEEDPEDCLAPDSIEQSNPRRICVICFEAPRDCFFLPCGHCAACFTCGTRIAEAECTCPICRRNMKKVRKIFTV